MLSNSNILFYIAAYLVSGIPFGYLLAKYFADIDIKKEGSGNIGATNVLRVLKEHNPSMARRLGALTLLLDAFKGVAILMCAKLAGLEPSALWTIAVLSVWGHCFSVYLGFEGGKGVATGFGVLLFLIPYAAFFALGAWILTAKTVKISSLSSLAALLVLVAASYYLYREIPGIGSHAPIWIIALTIFYKHLPNLFRLISRKEEPAV